MENAKWKFCLHFNTIEFQEQRRKTGVIFRNRCPVWEEVFVLYALFSSLIGVLILLQQCKEYARRIECNNYSVGQRQDTEGQFYRNGMEMRH